MIKIANVFLVALPHTSAARLAMDGNACPVPNATCDWEEREMNVGNRTFITALSCSPGWALAKSLDDALKERHELFVQGGSRLAPWDKHRGRMIPSTPAVALENACIACPVPNATCDWDERETNVGNRTFITALSCSPGWALAKSLDDALKERHELFVQGGSRLAPWDKESGRMIPSTPAVDLKDACIDQLDKSTPPAQPIPLEHLGFYGSETDTLADEMKKFKKGSLVLLQSLQDDLFLQADRDVWAKDFTDGKSDCLKLLDAVQCAKKYKDSLVVVVEEELSGWEDGAHYFPLEAQRELVVHGRPRQRNPLSAGHVPTTYYEQGRVQIIDRLLPHKTPNSHITTEGELVNFSVSKEYLRLLRSVIGDGLLASDWTPCPSSSSPRFYGLKMWLRPTVEFASIAPLRKGQISAELQKMRLALQRAFGRKSEVEQNRHLFVSFSERKLVSATDATKLLDDLSSLMKEN